MGQAQGKRWAGVRAGVNGAGSGLGAAALTTFMVSVYGNLSNYEEGARPGVGIFL